MRSSCFLMVVILASGIASSSSLAENEAANSVPASLIKDLGKFLAEAGSIWSSSGMNGVAGGSAVEATNMEAKLEARVDKDTTRNSVKCFTEEFCKKKKVICTKKCSKTEGVGIEHIKGKCVTKCSKCIPTC